jgi:hypothetical protein
MYPTVRWFSLAVTVFFLFANCRMGAQSQMTSVDWEALQGKWECERVMLVRKKTAAAKNRDSVNISGEYKPYFCYYSGEAKYKDEFPNKGHYSSVDGIYKIDKNGRKISFFDMMQTTKYTGGKLTVPDLVMKTGKQDVIVIKLNATSLVLLEKFTPLTESQGDYVYFMRKVVKK